jgi:tetratricopeptide (TPR) repeat protein
VTVSASLVTVPGGDVRGTAEPVSGPVDSIDALLRRTTTNLLAAVGGQVRGAGTRFTESPTAMRAYLEGLSAWRRGRLNEAAVAFDRAIAEDSAFAQARFRRYLASSWGVPSTVTAGTYARLAFGRRDGLSQRERATIEALLGPHYPAPRPVEERLAARQALTERYPDSPDGWYFLGDYYFHFGRPFAPTRYLEIAREAFERSAAIDSQATLLNHLTWIGIITQDTGLLRRAAPALDRTEDPSKWMQGWLAAATTGDASRLAALRRRPVDHADEPEAVMGAFAASGAVIPPGLMDEMFRRWTEATGEAARRQDVQLWHGVALALTGRPGAAERTWAAMPAGPAAADEMRLVLDLAGDATGLDVASAVRRLEASVGGDPASVTDAACLLELWRRDHGEGARADAARFRDLRRCARAIDAATLGRSQASGADTQLAAVDSAMHWAFTSTADAAPFEGPVVARAWERRGNVQRALAAVRHNINPVAGLRDEGRLAAMAGDTTGALFAYRWWLRRTTYAEPVLQPARDSVRAEVARLERR